MIETIQKYAQSIVSGNEKVVPGMEYKISEAADVGEGVWQGDLGLEIIESVPDEYTLQYNPTLQLVPGNTIGSKHCLQSIKGVKVYYHKEYSDSYDGLLGPILTFVEEGRITHPTHGDIVIPAGFTIQCRYQRVWEEELRKERRARD